MNASHIEAFRIAHDSGQMTVRSFYNYYEEPRSAADVDNLIARMGEIKPFQGDDWFDLTGYGDAPWLRLMIMAPNHPKRYGTTNTMPLFRDLEGPAAAVTVDNVQPATVVKWHRRGFSCCGCESIRSVVPRSDRPAQRDAPDRGQRKFRQTPQIHRPRR